LKYIPLESGIRYNIAMKTKKHAVDTQQILDKLRSLLEERDWSLSQLAAHADISDSTVYSWFNRNVHPSPESLSKICGACNITLNELYAVNDEELYTTKIKLLVDHCKGLKEGHIDELIRIAKIFRDGP